jgi:hypothetical protein
VLRDPFAVTSASSSESRIEKPCQTDLTLWGGGTPDSSSPSDRAHGDLSYEHRVTREKKQSLAGLRSVTGSSDEGLEQGLI